MLSLVVERCSRIQVTAVGVIVTRKGGQCEKNDCGLLCVCMIHIRHRILVQILGMCTAFRPRGLQRAPEVAAPRCLWQQQQQQQLCDV